MTGAGATNPGASAPDAIHPQQARLDRWASVEGRNFASPEVAELYRQRTQRFRDIIDLKTPDRVPALMTAAGFVTRHAGISFGDTFYNAERSGMAAMKFCEDFRPEYSLFNGGAATGPAFDLLGYKAYKWPGGTLPDDVPFQYVEAEFMPPEDYDALINNPEGYLLRGYLPSVCSELAGLRQIPSLVTTVEMLGVSMWLGGLAAPPVHAALTKLAQAAEHAGKAMADSMRTGAQMVARYGCPPLVGGVSKAPMDLVADTLRGTRAAALDLYRRPAKLLAASEALVPTAVHMGIGTGQPGPPPFVFMPLHKGAAGFMSFKQFEKFYWPTFKRVMEGIIAAGMVPLPFVEGTFDEPRLELIANSGLPRGRTVWLFDRSDMKVVRKHFGGFAAFGGNVPVSLFRAGTPAEMEAHCKQLIDEIAPGGGYFLASGAPVDEADAAVVKAFIGCAEKYGVY
ncbi:MAG: uroporphyrinogen decarboxylase family protein [Steroidobacteraceae bacterium]